MTDDNEIGRVIRYADQFPRIDREEEARLAYRWHQNHDEQARHVLFTSHMRQCAGVAVRHRGYQLSTWDLFSEGCIGLLEAIDRFEPERDIRLATFARYHIQEKIHHFILANWHQVKGRRDTAAKKLLFKLAELRRELNIKGRKIGTDDEIDTIANATGFDRTVVADFLVRRRPDNLVSTEAETMEGANILVGDRIADDEEHERNLLDTIEHDEKIGTLYDTIEQNLNAREREIILERWLTETPATLGYFADRYRVSRERVRQIESGAHDKLKRATDRLEAARSA